VFVANHLSMIDIMMIFMTIKKPAVFIGKSELDRLPLFTTIYKRAAILVGRDSASSRKRVYYQAKHKIEIGFNIMLYPEGLVPEPEVFLAPFKNGAFSLAIQFQIPIVPITFLDCEKKFPYFFAYNHFYGSPGKLRANVHEFIETKGLNQENREFLKEKVYDIMHKDLLSNSSQN
jgi:1-acyl-sn-glycerol-3-phosphate acyltransferase